MNRQKKDKTPGDNHPVILFERKSLPQHRVRRLLKARAAFLESRVEEMPFTAVGPRIGAALG